MNMKQIGALGEAAVVVALFFLLRNLMAGTGFVDWQKSVFGAALVSSLLLLFVVPFVATLVVGRNPGRDGLVEGEFQYHARIGWRGASVLLPATLLFPLLALLETDHKEWGGGLIMLAGFGAASLIAARLISRSGNAASKEISLRGSFLYIVLLVGGLLLAALVRPLSPVLTRVVQMLIFVGFLEEYFFRGYLQARLNDAFGRRLMLLGVQVGPGLFLSAAAFGLFHTFTIRQGTPWAWALWTAVVGLLFGYMRDKTGGVLASAITHALIVLPKAIFTS